MSNPGELPFDQFVAEFAQAIAYLRSYTHPYLMSRHGSVFYMQDQARTSGDMRAERFYAIHRDTEDVIRTIQKLYTRNFFLIACIPNNLDPKKIKSEIKARQFRLMHSEPMYTMPLSTWRTEPISNDIRRVLTYEPAEQIREIWNARELLPEHLNVDDSDVRLYAAYEKERPIGWVKSVRCQAGCNWVSNLNVVESHRRRGIGTRLMNYLLNEDKRYGVQHSILLASADGNHLYPKLGYSQIGLAQIYSPIKSKWSL